MSGPVAGKQIELRRGLSCGVKRMGWMEGVYGLKRFVLTLDVSKGRTSNFFF